jgi:hypothetical protein
MTSQIQALIHDDTVENVFITSSQEVRVQKSDGTLTAVGPVADSDRELLDFLGGFRD